MKLKLTMALGMGFALFGLAAHADPNVSTIALSTCIEPSPPTLNVALDGDTSHDVSYGQALAQEIADGCGSAAWDAPYFDTTDNTCTWSCSGDTFWGQSIDFYYKTRETDMLIITPEVGTPITQQITKESINTTTYSQQFNAGECQNRADFAAEALAYFDHYYQNVITPQLCH